MRKRMLILFLFVLFNAILISAYMNYNSNCNDRWNDNWDGWHDYSNCEDYYD